MTQLIDEATGLVYVVKRPSPEQRDYTVDFSNLLLFATIASIVSITISVYSGTPNTTPLVSSAGTISNSVIFITLSGGTDGLVYEIKTIIIDTAGNELVDSFLVKCKKYGTT